MILVDTTVWVDHFRAADGKLAALLSQAQMLGHPFVLGELALGNLRRRGQVLNALSNLPQATLATHAEVMAFVERQALFGRGIGYIDVHLLAATMLTSGANLWTRDKRLQAMAAQLGLASP